MSSEKMHVNSQAGGLFLRRSYIVKSCFGLERRFPIFQTLLKCHFLKKFLIKLIRGHSRSKIQKNITKGDA